MHADVHKTDRTTKGEMNSDATRQQIIQQIQLHTWQRDTGQHKGDAIRHIRWICTHEQDIFIDMQTEDLKKGRNFLPQTLDTRDTIHHCTRLDPRLNNSNTRTSTKKT